MQVFIVNNKIRFTQGVQTFTLSYEDETNLEWMAEQLNTAFDNFKKEAIAREIAGEAQRSAYMEQYEYSITPVSYSDYSEYVDILDDYGREGWLFLQIIQTYHNSPSPGVITHDWVCARKIQPDGNKGQ